MLRHTYRNFTWIFLGLLLASGASCRKQEEKQTEKATAPKQATTQSVVKPKISAPTQIPATGIVEEPLKYDGYTLAEKDGLKAIPFIYQNTSGDERFEIISAAMSAIEKNFNQAEILELARQLNPGRSRDCVIMKAMEAKPAPIRDMLAQLQQLEPDERNYPWLLIKMNSKIESLEDFNLLLEAAAHDDSLDPSFRKSIQEGFMGKYAGLLSKKDTDSAIAGVKALPVEMQATVAESLAACLSYDETGAGYDKALKLASAMDDQAVAAEKMYVMCLRIMGEEKPDSLGNRLDQIPADYRAEALQGYVSAWMKEDPMAASEWARKQSASDQQAAAVSIVRYLEYRKAPAEEIAPWRKIRDTAK